MAMLESFPATTLVTLATTFLILLGTTYLWGYYIEFEVNILEYLTPIDIIMQSASSIAAFFLSLVLAVAIMYANLGSESALITAKIPRRWRKPLSGAIVVFVGAGLFSYATLHPTAENYVRVVFWAAICTAVHLSGSPIILGRPKGRLFRTMLAFWVLAGPPVFFLNGAAKAQGIIAGTNFSYVPARADTRYVDDVQLVKSRLRYVGHAGDFIFLFDPQKRNVIIDKFESLRPLILRRYFERSFGLPAVDEGVP